jgi:hypothetical protein
VASGDPKNDLRERTKSFALRIIRMFSALPKNTEAQVLGKQVLRSGTSVGANWLELLVEAELVVAEKLAPLRQECEELTAIFVSIIKSSRRPPRS